MIYATLFLLLAHWFCDFVIQTNAMAGNKYNSWSSMMEHVLTYSLCLYIWLLLLVGPVVAIYLMFINGTTHLVIDTYTSRMNHALWEEKRFHGFFVSVGFDQLLHVSILLYTFYKFGGLYQWWNALT